MSTYAPQALARDIPFLMPRNSRESQQPTAIGSKNFIKVSNSTIRRIHVLRYAARPSEALCEGRGVFENFGFEEQLPQGRLVVNPIQNEDISAASVVLTRAFATSPQGIPLEECRDYCRKMLDSPPKGTLLVGRVFPPNDPGATVDWLRSGDASRLVAAAAISFDPISRDTFLSLVPPDEEAYLCNIAIDPRFRRQGIARKMLAACEMLAKRCAFQRIYLHVRLGDEPARTLYDTSGYKEVDADSWLVKLKGRTPTALLVKDFD